MTRFLVAVTIAAALASVTPARAEDRVGPIRTSVHELYTVTPPSAAELAPYLTRGSGSVSGRLRLTLFGAGHRRTYQNVPVFLLPRVPAAYDFAAGVDQVADDPHTPIAGLDKTLATATRRTLTDTNGAFTFANVPPGTYIVVAGIINVDLSTRVISTGSTRVHDYTDDFLGIEYYHTETSHFDTTYACTVNASMQATVQLAAGQNVVTALAMTGWSYQNDCDAMNLAS